MWTPRETVQALREDQSAILSEWQAAARERLWHLDRALFTRKGAATRCARVTIGTLIDLCQGSFSDLLAMPAGQAAEVERLAPVLNEEEPDEEEPEGEDEVENEGQNPGQAAAAPDSIREAPDRQTFESLFAEADEVRSCSPRSLLETAVRPASECWIGLPCAWSDTRGMLELLSDRLRDAIIARGADAETALCVDAVVSAIAASVADSRIRLIEREFAAHRQEYTVTQHLASRFLANASHELRTPLTAILGFSDLLLEESFGPINEAQQTAINHIENSAQNLLEVINNLLDMLRIRSGKITLQYRQVAVAPLLDAVFEILTPLSERKNVGFTKDVQADLGTIEADESIFRHIVYNLLASALRATPTGGEVRLRAQRIGAELVITTHDTALQLPPEALTHMSDILPKLENSPARGYEGWEAGLPLVRRYVELHDGALTLRSEPTGGTTFEVRVPVGRRSARPA
jgi:signal transduction histidine kinase